MRPAQVGKIASVKKLQILGGLLLAGALVGCAGGDKTAPGAEGKTPETPVAQAPANVPAGSDAPTADAPKATAPSEAGAKPTALLTAAQLRMLVTEIGKVTGHGGLSPADVEDISKEMEKVPKGESKTNPVHIDFQGRHLDVPLTIDHKEAGKYTVTFDTTDPALAEMLNGMLQTATK